MTWRADNSPNELEHLCPLWMEYSFYAAMLSIATWSVLRAFGESPPLDLASELAFALVLLAGLYGAIREEISNAE